MAYRNELDALTARKASLEADVRDRTRELEATRKLVDELQARARLPVLDNIRVAAPCSASWDAMTGDARVRACGDCQQSVYNLSDMTRDEAEALIHEKEGRLCVRYFQRADGTILLKDCAVGVKRRRRRRVVAAGIAASLAGAAFGVTRSRTTMGEMQVTTGVAVVGGAEARPALMGKIAIRPLAEEQAPEPPPSQALPTPVEIKGNISPEPPPPPSAPATPARNR